MPRLSVASFNARWGLTMTDTPFDLGDALGRLDADVVALQELWQPHDGPPTLDGLAAALGYQVITTPLAASTLIPHPQITHRPEQATGHWGIALLSRLPVTRMRHVDLGRAVERWDVARRLAVVAEIDVAGSPVAVAAAHLSFALPNALAQLRRLDGEVPRHLPSIVAGDCNAWGALARLLVRQRRRAVRGPTWPAHRPHSQVDHILVSHDVAVVESRVGPPLGSDHLPVRAVLEIGGRADRMITPATG